MKNQGAYERFAELCLEGFDENGSVESLAASAVRFGAIRACFLAGESIEGDAALQSATLDFKALARGVSTELIRNVDVGLSLLAEFCDAKSRAIQYRLDGKIAVAMRLEAVAEARYQQLPREFRW